MGNNTNRAGPGSGACPPEVTDIAQEEQAYKEPDGCPTEKAVLTRDWRKMRQQLKDKESEIAEYKALITQLQEEIKQLHNLNNQ